MRGSVTHRLATPIGVAHIPRVQVIPFGRIRWVKSVSLDEDQLAYAGRDRTVLAREPRRRGDHFELHATPDDRESLEDPEVDDLIVLTQHDLVTHLIKVVSPHVVARPKSSMRRGTRDQRFSVQRTCALVLLCELDEAPSTEKAFGFDPNAGGGEVFRIEALDAYRASDQPLWAVQRRIVQAMKRADVPGTTPREEPMRRIEQGPGRVERSTK